MHGERPGVFVISLDTELAWGCFDTVGVAAHEPAYRRTRQVIDDLCRLFDEYDVPVTWALTTHLLEDCGGDPGVHEGRPAPSYDWIDDWFGSLPCVTGASKDLWYAPDVLDRIRACDADHEVGLHGYTHMILGANGCDRAAATQEIETTVEIARAHGVDPETFVFPRNEIGHLEALRTHGIGTYRGRSPRWFERASIPEGLRKPFRFVDEAGLFEPPTVVPRTRSGLVEIPSSMIFRPAHGGWQYTPARSQYVRATKGLERAAETGSIFHLWFHPFNLGLDPDVLLGRLESILQRAAELRGANDLEAMTMADVAAAARDGRWDPVQSM